MRVLISRGSVILCELVICEYLGVRGLKVLIPELLEVLVLILTSVLWLHVGISAWCAIEQSDSCAVACLRGLLQLHDRVVSSDQFRP